MAEEGGPEEVRQRYVTTMGRELGQLFHLLWNECSWLHWKWSDYVILFGSKPERIDLLNQAAPAFFKLVQDTMWEDILLHMCRLTDLPTSRRGKHTLTLRRLPDLVPTAIRRDVHSLLQEAIRKCEFARDWRNRRIAHRDLDHSLNEHAVPLAQASRTGVRDALKAIVDLLNYVEQHQCESSTFYEGISPHGNAESLLYVLRNGIEADASRRRRLISGNPLPEDLRPPIAI